MYLGYFLCRTLKILQHIKVLLIAAGVLCRLFMTEVHGTTVASKCMVRLKGGGGGGRGGKDKSSMGLQCECTTAEMYTTAVRSLTAR